MAWKYRLGELVIARKDADWIPARIVGQSSGLHARPHYTVESRCGKFEWQCDARDIREPQETQTKGKK